MIRLSADVLRKVYPHAIPGVVESFVSDEGQGWLAKAGINANRKRLAVALAHCAHETGGFTIRNLTENIYYTADRMAAVWPKRFASAAAVRSKYGMASGWQLRAIDDIYGGRMGNRPHSSDGSSFIGRGGPQITGRDGYREVGKRCGLDLENDPTLACKPENQAKILAGFWMWKGLSRLADSGGIDATVVPWNGGTNGLGERRAEYARILPLLNECPDVAELAHPVIVPPPVPAGAAPVVVKGAAGATAGGTAAAAAHKAGLSIGWVIAIGVVAAVVAWIAIHKFTAKKDSAS